MIAALAGSASAQQVTDPTRGEFDPSSDHDTILADGTPAVQDYLFELYLLGAPQPLQTTSFGKPNPDPNGIIRVNLATIFAAWAVPGTMYEAPECPRMLFLRSTTGSKASARMAA